MLFYCDCWALFAPPQKGYPKQEVFDWLPYISFQVYFLLEEAISGHALYFVIDCER